MVTPTTPVSDDIEICWTGSYSNVSLIDWEPVVINAGEGTSGYYIKGGEFVGSSSQEFGGWLGKFIKSPINLQLMAFI